MADSKMQKKIELIMHPRSLHNDFDSSAPKTLQESLAKVAQCVIHRQLPFPTHMTFVNSGLEESHCNDWVQPWYS